MVGAGLREIQKFKFLCRFSFFKEDIPPVKRYRKLSKTKKVLKLNLPTLTRTSEKLLLKVVFIFYAVRQFFHDTDDTGALFYLFFDYFQTFSLNRALLYPKNVIILFS